MNAILEDTRAAGEYATTRPLVWPCLVFILFSSSLHVLGPPLIFAESIGLFALLLQSSSRRRAQKGAWHTWPGSPHLATGLHGDICIQIDSRGEMRAAAQNRFYNWP